MVLSEVSPRELAFHSVTAEEANHVLGRDRVFGIEAIRQIERDLQYEGYCVRIDVDSSAFPYSREDLKYAQKANEALFLRPSAIRLDGKNILARHEIESTISPTAGFWNLFLMDPRKTDTERDPLLEPMSSLYGPTNQLGNSDQYLLQSYKHGSMDIKPGWSLVSAVPLFLNSNYVKQTEELGELQTVLGQQGLRAQSLRRRTAAEALWDSILYYFATGKRFLMSDDWTSTLVRERAKRGTKVVSVSQQTDHSHVGIHMWWLNSVFAYPKTGVYPSR